MMCLKTFKVKGKEDFNTWSEWVSFVNSNYSNYVNNFVGKCNSWDLPSSHPYWKNEAKNIIKEQINILEVNYEICKNNPDKIKYLYNKTTSLEDLEIRINKLKLKCQ